MPRRPTAPSSRRDSLHDRLDDVGGDNDCSTYDGEPIHEPSIVVALSAREDDCIDEERDLYRFKRTLYHIPDGILGELFDDGGADA
jgi:hypothetical protein